MSQSEIYRGYEIYRNDFRGRECWIAGKVGGITMNTNTYEGIKTMVDAKIWLRQEQLRELEAGIREESV